ncbi:DUF2975 domain-containing protein [Aquimonas sp.]|jgi:hypothetical protein|uniref:DUF2975 domain-containing protein n=1 Tax=Aquimonas sp. TaxID=1872588 RepID=UPI0037BE3A67
MNTAPHLQAAEFRRQCRVLRIATVCVLIGLLALILPGLAGLPIGLADIGALTDAQRWLLRGIQGLPAVGYLWALWSAQFALGELAAGRSFHTTVARALRWIGLGVLAGALLQVFAVINLMRFVLDAPGSYVYFELSAIVLGVIGAALVLVARVIDQARALQAELDEII